jgi:hypothetical protein
MSIKTISVGLVLAGGLAAAAPAYSQAHCADRDGVIERLGDSYGETLAAGGLRSATQVLEVWAAPETGTWTVLITGADGKTCVLATGTDWHQHGPDPRLTGVPG